MDLSWLYFATSCPLFPGTILREGYHIIEASKTELQTMMTMDYGVVYIKVTNKTGFTLENCYAELKAVQWEGDSYFTNYEKKLLWIDKHFNYDGNRTKIEHEDYQYIGLGQKNTNFRGDAKFYNEGSFPIKIKFGKHKVKNQFGSEIQSGKAVTLVFEVVLENYLNQPMELDKKIMNIEIK